MKFNRLGAFTLGVVVATVSVGAVTYANAASSSNVRVCADKATGVLRYVPSTSCKNSENTLSWNIAGTEGSQGSVGTTGPTTAPTTKSGAVGAKKKTIHYMSDDSCSPGKNDFHPNPGPYLFSPSSLSGDLSTGLVDRYNWEQPKYCKMDVVVP